MYVESVMGSESKGHSTERGRARPKREERLELGQEGGGSERVKRQRIGDKLKIGSCAMLPPPIFH
jgi:hypothetical protein